MDSNRLPVPDHAAFRACIDTLFPAHAPRIAVARAIYSARHAPLLDDLRAHLAPALFATLEPDEIDDTEKALRLMLRRDRHARRHSLSFCYTYALPPPHIPRRRHDAADKLDILLGQGDDTDQHYLVTDYGRSTACLIHVNNEPPHLFLHSIATADANISLRLKFNQAALAPAIARWHVFFHELAHGLTALGAAGSPPLDPRTTVATYRYLKAREEAACDAFATIMTLRQCGETALPFINTFAAMRLSRLGRAGHSYHTAPAIRAVAAAYRANRLDDALADPYAALRHAHDTARAHFVPRPAFRALEKRFKTIDSPFAALIGIDTTTARHDAVDKILGREYGMAALINESRTILRRDYAQAALPAYGGALWRAVKSIPRRLGL